MPNATGQTRKAVIIQCIKTTVRSGWPVIPSHRHVKVRGQQPARPVISIPNAKAARARNRRNIKKTRHIQGLAPEVMQASSNLMFFIILCIENISILLKFRTTEIQAFAYDIVVDSINEIILRPLPRPLCGHPLHSRLRKGHFDMIAI